MTKRDAFYERADHGIAGHYYKYLGTDATIDTSVADYSNTDTWEDVTEIASPDEDSYINMSDSYVAVIEEFVRMKLADKTDDIKLKVYREHQFLKKHSRARKMNSGGPKLIYPKKPFSFN